MKKQWWIPIFVVTFFCLESLFANFFPSKLFSNYWIIVPRFLFLYLIFMTVYYDSKKGIIYGAIIGLVMDIVFTGILGIYLLWYPVVIYLVSKLMKFWHSNLFIMAIVSLLAIILTEFGIYGIFSLLQIATIPVKYFTNHRLIPTLILNFIFYLFFSYSMKNYFLQLRKLKEEEGMFQS
ncbi:rod shape-determining protein MreD [Bacillus andreraoultii]|uniref:rod shape-determining protein MreD n=1 Tax=Bacillus andreraoultii TaxID=1499685 RepID=UPI00053ABFD3|nr:rod shape-determining protein MreD [Bacillus andreraoultii]